MNICGNLRIHLSALDTQRCSVIGTQYSPLLNIQDFRLRGRWQYLTVCRLWVQFILRAPSVEALTRISAGTMGLSSSSPPCASPAPLENGSGVGVGITPREAPGSRGEACSLQQAEMLEHIHHRAMLTSTRCHF